MASMSNKEWVQATWALAKLSPPGTAAPAGFVERFWVQAHLRSGRLAPGEATLLLWAVGRLGLDAPPRWLAGQLAAAQRALPSYRPDQLAATVVSLARMGRAPPPAWMGAFEAAARLEEFGLQVGPAARRRRGPMPPPRRRPPPAPRPVLAPLLTAAPCPLPLQTTPSPPPPQELVNVLWAFSALRYTPSLPWQHACVSALRAACAGACGEGAPFAAEAVGALLEEAGLLPVLSEAVAAQVAADAELGPAAAGGGPGAECPLSFGFELPLGAA
jgi:hypothetical protein